ncbi:MAG: nuclear transport factor 2 family protein [Bacteroidetes bacterium]|nr:nuclear transport factor 2 family protein [Bacteroidota bacterium]
MKKIPFSFLLLVGSFILHAQSKDEQAIRKLMAKQTEAWNRGSIEDFMRSYWDNDSLTFIGHGGITYGYTNTLNNYKATYSDTSKMGKLFFTLISVKKLSPEYAFVTGKWFLKRTVGDIGGFYTLLFRKMNGRWFIVTDHSS